jgi:hypothetical protein
MADYPIIDQRSLPRASRRGPMGLAPPRREASELPMPNAHEVVVYKTEGTYIVDDGRSRPSDDHIVKATSITVVDMREDTPITVEATIPSAGVAEFTVQVTFLCTVKKPDEVVDAGLRDIKNSLKHYLIRHQPLFYLGEDHHLDQVAAVRRNVTAEVKAYYSVRPARFRGLDVKLGNIQVMTPDELRSKQREWELQGLLSLEQQQLEHRLAEQKAELEEVRRRNEEAFELERRRHEQDLAQMRQELTRMQEQFEQQQERRRATHDQSIRTASFQHAAGEAARLKESLGADESEMTTIFAAAIGERGISATAKVLNDDRERRREQEAEDELRKQEREQEEARYGRQLDRENRQMRYDLEVQKLKVQADVVVAAVNRGLADTQDIEYLMSELKHVTKQLESASSSAQQQETDRGESPERPKRPARPWRSRWAGRSEVQDDDRVLEAQIVPEDSDVRSDDAEPELREEDLGR